MCAAAGIILDALDHVRSGATTIEINCPNPPLRTTTSMPNSDSSIDVTTTFSVALLREGQG
jgi:hypothetical protein